MLSKRVIAGLILKDGLVVQSRGFSSYLPIGSPEIAVEFLNLWGADEIVVLEIGKDRANRGPDFSLIERLSRKGQVPLTVGGGIESLDTMHRLIQGGADKFVLNRAALRMPELITEAAAIFGNQCVVVSIDVRKNDSGAYEAYIDSGATPTGREAVELARDCAALGAGEILIRSIERDGSQLGFDIELVRAVADAVPVPVIAAGGCGHPKHIVEAFEHGGAAAVCVGNMFHYTEHSVITAKASVGTFVPVRRDTHATYENARFDERARLCKQDDTALNMMRFEYHPKEII